MMTYVWAISDAKRGGEMVTPLYYLKSNNLITMKMIQTLLVDSVISMQTATIRAEMSSSLQELLDSELLEYFITELTGLSEGN